MIVVTGMFTYRNARKSITTSVPRKSGHGAGMLRTPGKDPVKFHGSHRFSELLSSSVNISNVRIDLFLVFGRRSRILGLFGNVRSSRILYNEDNRKF